MTGWMLRQAKPRLWLGAARDLMQRAQSYYGLLNAGMMLITVYTVRESTIQAHAPWLNLVAFAAIVAAVMVVIMLLDYRLIYPSQIAFHQHEAWKHRSPVRRDLEGTAARLDRIEAALGRIEEQLHGRT